jgi:hypothetical protein
MAKGENIKIRRITIDIDVKHVIPVLRVIIVLKHYGFAKFELKDTKRGIHIIAWHKEGYYWNRILWIRKLAGDDPKRILIDRSKKKKSIAKQVLFTDKKREVLRYGRRIKKRRSRSRRRKS